MTPLRHCARPWLSKDQAHHTACCPTCRTSFPFLASEGVRFQHKERGECWKLTCPCCGHKLAKETPGTEIGVPKIVNTSDVFSSPIKPKVTKPVTSRPEDGLF